MAYISAEEEYAHLKACRVFRGLRMQWDDAPDFDSLEIHHGIYDAPEPEKSVGIPQRDEDPPIAVVFTDPQKKLWEHRVLAKAGVAASGDAGCQKAPEPEQQRKPQDQTPPQHSRQEVNAAYRATAVAISERDREIQELLSLDPSTWESYAKDRRWQAAEVSLVSANDGICKCFRVTALVCNLPVLHSNKMYEIVLATFAMDRTSSQQHKTSNFKSEARPNGKWASARHSTQLADTHPHVGVHVQHHRKC